MNNLVFLGPIFSILILILQTHSIYAHSYPQHCLGYNACYTIGYRDGYDDVQNGISPAYACMGHSENWCSGYNSGFRAGNGGNNIFYGQKSDQTANINIHGDNNKITVNQQSDNQMGFTLSHGVLPNCVILCLNSNVRIR